MRLRCHRSILVRHSRRDAGGGKAATGGGAQFRLDAGGIEEQRYAVELEMEKKKFKFVNLDVDLYESTLQSLAWFWPRMVSGGWIVTHNYNLTYGKWGNTPGVKKSFKEFLKGDSCRIVEIAETQALIVKP